MTDGFKPDGAFGFGGYPSAETIEMEDWAAKIFRPNSVPRETRTKGDDPDGADCVYHVRTDRLGIRDAVGGP